ncbi:hypothetical protein HDU98_002626 [Podochytrium sp. JEL0797]|nr:hypothetical protein HDU98_002626 [Podochytrium sp. JEL0797]
MSLVLDALLCHGAFDQVASGQHLMAKGKAVTDSLGDEEARQLAQLSSLLMTKCGVSIETGSPVFASFALDHKESAKVGETLEATVLLARLALLQGDASLAVAKLTNLVVANDPSQPTKLDALRKDSKQYSKVVYLMAITILAQAYLSLRDFEQSMKCFQLAKQYINSKPFVLPSLTVVSNPELRKSVEAGGVQDQWNVWCEEALYSYCALLVALDQKSDPNQLITISHAYTLLFSPSPVSFVPSKRATILRLYLTTLAQSSSSPAALLPSPQPKHHHHNRHSTIAGTKLFPFGVVSPFTGVSASPVLMPPTLSHDVVLAFQTLLPLYESLVVAVCSFPVLAGGHGGVREVEEGLMKVREARVVECFEWWGVVESCCGGEGEGRGVWDVVERGYRVVETMYRGTKYTFQNFTLLRHLSHAWVDLLAHLCDSASDEEVTEGVLAVKAYVGVYRLRRGEAEKLAGHGVREVGWERVEDVVGLDTAREYIDYAIELLTAHETATGHASDSAALWSEVYRLKGVVYGEVAMEVPSLEDRGKFQGEALKALVQAKERVGDGWEVLYQVAVQRAEMGEISEAIMAIQESLRLNSSPVSSWHLLALLLTSLRQYPQALEVCEAGWKEGLDGLPVQTGVVVAEGEEEMWIVWEGVEGRVKEDLFNLKLTHLAIIEHSLGPKAALEALQPLFSLFSRMFNPLLKALDVAAGGGGAGGVATTPVAYSYASSEASSVSARVAGGGGSPALAHRDRMASENPARSRVATSGSENVAAACPPFFGYSFRMYDLQVAVWNAAGRVYSDLGMFGDSALAVREAEAVARGWILVNSKVRGREAGVFEGRGGGQGLDKGVARVKAGEGKKEGEVGARWGVAGGSLRRVLADICFGNALLKRAKYQASLEPVAAPSFAKYLPVSSDKYAPAGQERAASPLTRQNSVQSTFTVHRTGASGSRSIKSASLPVVAQQASLSPDRRGSAASPVKGGGSPASSVLTAPRIFSGAPVPSSGMEEEKVTIEMVIDELLVCVALDEAHVAAQVLLGRMYQEKSGQSLAEARYWFSRVCWNGKGSGSGGGIGGVGTHFGGYEVDAWKGLGEVLWETGAGGGEVDVGRVEEAKECLLVGVQRERGSVVRGLQCLRRVV